MKNRLNVEADGHLEERRMLTWTVNYGQNVEDNAEYLSDDATQVVQRVSQGVAVMRQTFDEASNYTLNVGYLPGTAATYGSRVSSNEGNLWLSDKLMNAGNNIGWNQEMHEVLYGIGRAFGLEDLDSSSSYWNLMYQSDNNEGWWLNGNQLTDIVNDTVNNLEPDTASTGVSLNPDNYITDTATIPIYPMYA